jgi:lipopolysaccharide heptosyltransferase II
MSWNTAKNLLCIRLDTLGDILMTTPAFRALKRPDRRLTLLTSSAGAAIASFIPEIDQIITYDAPWLKATAPRHNPQPEYDMINHLRQFGFDGAVIFTVYSQNPLPSAFLCYMAEIPLRLAHCHENPYQLLTDWIKDPEPENGIRHEVQRQLDLVKQIGCQTTDQRLSLQVKDHISIPFDRWLIIHPGATASSRRYEHFAAVAEQLASEHGYEIIFTGTEPEKSLIQQIQTRMQARSHALVNLSLGELIALIKAAPLLISNNTGPVHIAAAVGTPVVDLYALTNPQHTPWQVPHRILSYDVPCKYCYKSICPEGHHHCLAKISPAEVVNAACELLTKSKVYA